MELSYWVCFGEVPVRDLEFNQDILQQIFGSALSRNPILVVSDTSDAATIHIDWGTAASLTKTTCAQTELQVVVEGGANIRIACTKQDGGAVLRFSRTEP